MSNNNNKSKKDNEKEREKELRAQREREGERTKKWNQIAAEESPMKFEALFRMYLDRYITDDAALARYVMFRFYLKTLIKVVARAYNLARCCGSSCTSQCPKRTSNTGAN
jgi:hypothetical protein